MQISSRVRTADRSRLRRGREAITASSLLVAAWEYREAGRLISDSSKQLLYVDDPTYLTHVRYFLALRSVELAGKALLRHFGYTAQELRKIGHDLQLLIKHLKKRKLCPITPKAIAVIRWFNRIYSVEKDFEYPLPAFDSLGAYRMFPYDLEGACDVLLEYADERIKMNRRDFIHLLKTSRFLKDFEVAHSISEAADNMVMVVSEFRPRV